MPTQWGSLSRNAEYDSSQDLAFSFCMSCCPNHLKHILRNYTNQDIVKPSMKYKV